MTTPRDGGAAFPGADPVNAVVGGKIIYAPGMSLRDYFAAHAMAAIISKAPYCKSENGQRNDEDAMARGAYSYADAMLRVRDGDAT
jgi:hypothetical protein